MDKSRGLKARLNAGTLARFAVTTFASAVVSLGVPVLVHQLLGVEQKTAVAISQGFLVLFNFAMIRIFVFRSTGNLSSDIPKYITSAVTFRGLEYIGFLLLLELADLYYLLALAIILTISTLLKFLWYRFLFADRGGRLS